MISRSNQQRGFTLIELLVVIAIISFVASLLFANFSNARGQARTARRVQDIGEVQKALELYRAQNDHYPIVTTAPTAYGAVCLECNNSTYNNSPAKTALSDALNPYLKQLPRDPSLPTGQTTFAESDRGYWYQSDGQDYKFVNVIYGDPTGSAPHDWQDNHFSSGRTTISIRSSTRSSDWTPTCQAAHCFAPANYSVYVSYDQSGSATYSVSPGGGSGTLGTTAIIPVTQNQDLTFTLNPPSYVRVEYGSSNYISGSPLSSLVIPNQATDPFPNTISVEIRSSASGPY